MASDKLLPKLEICKLSDSTSEEPNATKECSRKHENFRESFNIQPEKSHYLQVVESWNGLGWRGPLKIIWFQPPCHGQGHV